MMSDGARLSIAVGQFEAGPEKADNLALMVDMAGRARAAGADLVVFPEVGMVDAGDRRPADFAEPADGPFVTALGEAARREGIAIVAGILEAREAADGKVYNTAVALAPEGRLIGKYRKVHMYDAFGYRESDRNQPGDGDLLLFELGGMRLGVAICYDLRFPELFRALAERGAEVILLPTAWAHGRLKELHLATLVRARAIENTVYFVAADQVGGRHTGNSMVIDPMGVTVASLGEEEGLLVAEVDTARLHAVRAKLPTLLHLRPDVYQGWMRAPAGEVR